MGKKGVEILCGGNLTLGCELGRILGGSWRIEGGRKEWGELEWKERGGGMASEGNLALVSAL